VDESVNAVIEQVTEAAARHDARETVQRAGLADQVEFRLEDGGTALAATGTGEVDLLFLDAERTEYHSWWPHPVRVLRQGGVLVADNALSHPEEIAPLNALLTEDPQLVVTTIAVGKGELVALRQ
jgi:predicted O-methyltransferase YrrM